MILSREAYKYSLKAYSLSAHATHITYVGIQGVQLSLIDKRYESFSRFQFDRQHESNERVTQLYIFKKTSLRTFSNK